MSDNSQKKKIAAALEYDPATQGAPVLAAFGQGEVAERIIDTAFASGVPVIEDASLSSLLKQVSVGDEIPEELYEVVAQVLVFIGEAERKAGLK
jgi:flagellar biosynthesis protein